VNAIAREAELDELMSRLATGDRAAFAPLYAALRPRAIRVATMRLGVHQAADVAQSALLKVFARASEFTAGRPCLPWFYAIVANEIRSAERAAGRLVPAVVADDALVDERHAETLLVERELERALELAMQSLDADAMNAVGALLGRTTAPDISPAAFRKRVSRAYCRLRLLLRGHDVS
jgi:RNA polymerase sigma-70 factor (ECF subfamily)